MKFKLCFILQQIIKPYDMKLDAISKNPSQNYLSHGKQDAGMLCLATTHIAMKYQQFYT